MDDYVWTKSANRSSDLARLQQVCVKKVETGVQLKICETPEIARLPCERTNGDTFACSKQVTNDRRADKSRGSTYQDAMQR
jgi:hypothetical protein